MDKRTVNDKYSSTTKEILQQFLYMSGLLNPGTDGMRATEKKTTLEQVKARFNIQTKRFVLEQGGQLVQYFNTLYLLWLHNDDTSDIILLLS